MNLFRSLCLCFFLLSCGLTVQAQRVKNINDSTTYVINSADTVVAGRYRLYRVQQGQLQSFANFFDPADTSYFIRDFDFWGNQHFYVVLGSRYIGFETQVLRSFDGGQTWEQDTALIAAANQPFSADLSLNGMQTYGDSTMYAFDGYYQSYVIVSHNRGRTWHNWINSLISHWFQFMICDDGTHLIMSMGGDAFGGHLLYIPDSLFGRTNYQLQINFSSRLLVNSSSVRVLEPFFMSKRDSICALPLGLPERPRQQTMLSCYPNPSGGDMQVSWSGTAAQPEKLEVIDTQGRVVHRQTAPALPAGLSLAHLPNGLYLLRLSSKEQVLTQKLVVQQ